MSDPAPGTKSPSARASESRPGVVAIVSAPTADGVAATEFLRVLAALRALEVPVTLFEAGSGVGTLSTDRDLDPDGERYFDALREDGVVVHGPAALADALVAASAIIHLADPARPGTPAVFEVPRDRRLSDAELATLLKAGQVRQAG